ncbi:MAG: muramoyltetrapeptide carboxypeptidase [Alphaproteobacteria bacterium]|jgi:muramoyltetrapeptide carboxypeptidase
MTTRPLLKQGGTVLIVSPSWFRGEERTYAMESLLNTYGFEAETHVQCHVQFGQFAGSVEERAFAINEAFMDESIDAVICAAGGYGALQLLDGINYELIKKNPKPFVGYSDATALLNAIYAKTGLVTYHGPMGCCMSYKQHPETTQSFLDVVVAGEGQVKLAGNCLKSGEAAGILLGGNMTVFDQLIGTSYMPNADNIILFLEDTTDEKINELDKKLLHLRHSGVLKNVRGVILGEMDKLSDNETPFGKNTKQLVEEYLPNIPAVMNVKCGHDDSLLTFPVGAHIQLTVNDISSKLEF